MNLDDLTLGQIKQLQNLLGLKPDPTPVDHGVQIVILDRGFVYVGRVTTDSEWCYIKNAQNIRVWGTSRGLGELVDGPLASTRLDKTGNVKAALRAVIGFIAVEESKWTNSLL